MIRLPCVDCGSVDFPKVVRRKRSKYTGKWIYSRSKRCVICHRENQRLRYEKEKKNSRRYKNRLRLNREWAVKNKEKVKEYQQRYDRIHSTRIRERKHEYYLANKEKILARNKEWKDANRRPGAKTNKGHYWRKLEHGRIQTVISKRKIPYDTTSSATTKTN